MEERFILSMHLLGENFESFRFRCLLDDGVVLEAKAIVNIKWGDFSIVPIQNHLDGIEWQAAEDDTPSEVDLNIAYPSALYEEIIARIEDLGIVESYSIFTPSGFIKHPH